MATEPKAEGGATAREYGVFGRVCLCLHHRADHANYTDGCNNCSCAKFIHYPSAEPSQPSVQGQQDFRKDLEREWMAQDKWLDFTNWLIEVKLKSAPSITSERIAEIAVEL